MRFNTVVSNFSSLIKKQNIEAQVIKRSEYPQADGGDGTLAEEIVNHNYPNKKRNLPLLPFSLAITSLEEGKTSEDHSLKDTLELYLILKGKGEMFIDGQSKGEVGFLDTVVIPPGASQKIKNTGKGQLSFLCIDAPSFHHKNNIKKNLHTAPN